MSDIGDIATRIYDYEFDDAPTQLEREFRIESISGWLESNIGQLNNLTYQNFDKSSDFLQEEESILSALYLKNYYSKQSRTVLHVGVTGSPSWTRLTEGDTTIVRSSTSDTVRQYKDLSNEKTQEIESLVYAYNSYRAMPNQVAGIDGGYVTGSGSYG